MATDWQKIIGNDPDAFVNAFYNARPKWVTGSLSDSDARFLFRAALESRSSPAAEIGTASGFSTSVLCQAFYFASKAGLIDHNFRILSYDISPTFYADESKRVGDATREQLPPELLGHITFIHPAMAMDVRRRHGQGTLNFVFLDANHEHPWPTLDLLAILPSLRKCATVVLHDINLPIMAPQFQAWGVKYLFDDLRLDKNAPTDESIPNIGCITIPENKDKLRSQLTEILFAHSWESTVEEDYLAQLEIDRKALEGARGVLTSRPAMNSASRDPCVRSTNRGAPVEAPLRPPLDGGGQAANLRVAYLSLVSIIQERVATHIPSEAVVIVVSKGDDELLRFKDRVGWHFPQVPDGRYAGYNPADSRAAIEHLELLRASGGQYFVIPSTAFWWLDHYVDFRRHLEKIYRRVHHDEHCIIYDLSGRSWFSRQIGRLVGLRGGRKTASSAAVAPTGSSPTAPKPGGHLRVALDYPQTLPLCPPPGKPNPHHLDLHWILPDFELGTGGPMAIFRLVRSLEQFGHKNTIWIWRGFRYGKGTVARKFLQERFVPVQAEIRILNGDLNQVRGDAVIATYCWTAYLVRAVRNVRARYYLVQDFEPSFFPMGAEYLLAEATYRFGLRCITSSRWLEGLLRTSYGAEASRFAYAYDPALYNTGEGTARPPDRVAFYSRTKTARRAVDLGLLALERVAASVPSLTVDFFGGSPGRLDLPYRYTDQGVLDGRRLADLYRNATVGVVLSTTNYSLIPHEMMACGLPVVELDGPSTRAEFPVGAVALASPTLDGIAAEIVRLLTDPVSRERQVQRALDYICAISWEGSARQVEAVLVKGVLAEHL